MDVALIESLAAGGPIAILAGLIFILYIKHRDKTEKCIREDRVFMEDRLTKIIEMDQKSREEHTRVMSELATLLKHMNGTNGRK